MINNKKVLAIIPARGGSKGIPGKNIKLLNNKPLIAYTIEEAMKSKFLDRVIVSTDDYEIAEIAKKYGAEVPFIRPSELAKDDTPGIDPIIHCIEWLDENESFIPEYVICIQCTSPFRESKHIDEAVEMLDYNNGDSIVSVCESEISPYWMKRIEDNKLIDFVENSQFYARRQDTPKIYQLNGAIYIAKLELLKSVKGWYSNNTLPYIMDKQSSIDIDDILDFKYAEMLVKENING